MLRVLATRNFGTACVCVCWPTKQPCLWPWNVLCQKTLWRIRLGLCFHHMRLGLEKKKQQQIIFVLLIPKFACSLLKVVKKEILQSSFKLPGELKGKIPMIHIHEVWLTFDFFFTFFFTASFWSFNSFYDTKRFFRFYLTIESNFNHANVIHLQILFLFDFLQFIKFYFIFFEKRRIPVCW